MKEKQKQLEPMEEAYKLLDGSPAIDAVSKAAKGETPENSYEHEENAQEDMVDRLDGKPVKDTSSLEEAYANLFESLSVIARHGKSNC